VSDLARRGLRTPNAAKPGRIRLRSGVPVLPSRGEIVTVEHVDRLRDEEGV
jgi:hypothetical protein